MLNLEHIFKDIPKGAKKLGVIGHPLGHTLSPIMHMAAVQSLGLNAVYKAIPVPPDEFDDFIKQAQDLPLDGFNVTVPYKEKIKASGLPGFQAEAGEVMESFNTVWRVADKNKAEWRGASTDGIGFLDDVKSYGVDLTGKKIVLLGAGGAANSIVKAFCQYQVRPADVVLFDSDASRAMRLKESCENLCQADKDKLFPVSVIRHVGDMKSILQKADVVINATPVGLKENDRHLIDLSWLPKDLVLYDLIYHRQTELMKAVAEKGGRAIGGLGMLVHQGARSFEMWFGMKPPVDVMQKALQEELKITRK